MKKALSLFLTICLCALAVIPCFAADSTFTVTSSYAVYYTSSDLKPAAEKFADYIQKIIGSRPTVLGERPRGNYIGVSIDKAKIDNGYITQAQDENVQITGSSLQWAVRGLYNFLEKYGGISVYTSKLTVFKNKTIQVPVSLDTTYVPFFEYTDTDWLSPTDTEYSLFNGLNSAEYRTIPAEMGGSVDYISSFCHTLSSQFCSKDKYYAEHPEYFASFHGINNGTQLCLSNPEVLEIVTQEVLDLLKVKHDPNAELQIVSLTQNDNIAYCTCDKCRETDHKYGSHAGTMLEFVNAVARTVKSEGYDNVAIDTFAYRYTRKPPKGIVPEDNVIVRLCSIECCFSHAFDDKSCQTNVEFMEDLHGWSEICNRIYIWDYCTNYCNFVGLFPDFGVLQRNMQIFHENHVKGVYEEGNYTMKAEAEFGELRSYLISKLFQDPYCDFNAVRDDFIKAYYGKDAAPYISQFLDLITENASKNHLGIYESMVSTLSLFPSQIKKCDAMWENAKAKATEEELAHVKASEISWRWWKMKNHASEFASPFTYEERSEQLKKDIADNGVDRLMEVEETRSFFSSVFQFLYFKAYFLVNLVLKILYAA
ncbi:MAG TPA: hypothetical protein DDY98_00310 [Ruminococcaceae bacterium]|nr:hypothetical protein [Oscillospiraceae bacterium]